MKDIPGFEGKYAVTEDGRVWSYKHSKFLKPKPVNGYYMVDLFKDGIDKKYQVTVHRLVALTFIPNHDNLPCVNHKDESRTNNHVDNLEWCTFKHNSNYGTAVERLKANKTKEGYERAWAASAKVRSKPVRCMDLNTVYNSISEAAKTVGVCMTSIWKCCNGERKTAGGYRWSFE